MTEHGHTTTRDAAGASATTAVDGGASSAEHAGGQGARTGADGGASSAEHAGGQGARTGADGGASSAEHARGQAARTGADGGASPAEHAGGRRRGADADGGAFAAPGVVEVLEGGYTNAGKIVRVGDTVRRPWRPTSAATAALFEHLAAVGFDGAPRFLGRDEQGREVLTYVPGEAVLEPYPPWALTDEALVGVAQLLRRFHDAVASFDASRHEWEHRVPGRFCDGTISHNDPNLDNVVFRDGRAVALIDFDLASPGSAAWDVACAARLWAPLRDPVDLPPALRDGTVAASPRRSLERLRLFVDAYGLPAGQRARVVDALVAAHDWCYRIVRRAVQNGHGPFQRMWREGGEPKAERTRAWLAAHGDDMLAALVDSDDVPRKPVPNE
jgi:hypothetical protein